MRKYINKYDDEDDDDEMMMRTRDSFMFYMYIYLYKNKYFFKKTCGNMFKIEIDKVFQHTNKQSIISTVVH